MIDKFLRKTLIIALGLTMLSAGFSLAAPLNLVNPANGKSNVPVDDSFQWNAVGGAVKYILDVDQFTQSEDNILPGVCIGGLCVFDFLNMTIGNIEYLTTYTWRITAYNAAGNPIDASGDFSFISEQAPAPPSNGSNGNGNVNGTGGWRVPAINLKNPLDADTLWEALDAIVDLLLILAFAIAPIVIIYAAFLMIFKGQDPAALNRARTIILWVLIAIAVMLFAKGIPYVIKGALGG